MPAFDLHRTEKTDEIAGIRQEPIFRPVVVVVDEDVHDPCTGGDGRDFVGDLFFGIREIGFREFVPIKGALCLGRRESRSCVKQEIDRPFVIARSRRATTAGGTAGVVIAASECSFEIDLLDHLAACGRRIACVSARTIGIFETSNTVSSKLLTALSCGRSGAMGVVKTSDTEVECRVAMGIERIFFAILVGGATRTTARHPLALSASTTARALAFGSVGAGTIELIAFFARTLAGPPLWKSSSIRNASALSFDPDRTDAKSFFRITELTRGSIALAKPPCEVLLANANTCSRIRASAVFDISLGAALVVDHAALLASPPFCVFASLYALFEIRALTAFGVIFTAATDLTITRGISLAIGITGLAAHPACCAITAFFGVGRAAWASANAPLIVADAGLLSFACGAAVALTGLAERASVGLRFALTSAPSETIGVAGLGACFAIGASACLGLCSRTDGRLGSTFVASDQGDPQEKRKETESANQLPETTKKKPSNA